MKKQEKKMYEYVLEDQDIKVIKECLNYCFHRLTNHSHVGIFGIVGVKQINRLRKELEIIE